MNGADILLRGGTVHDGLGTDPFVADVLVVGDRIADVAGEIVPSPDCTILDVTGLEVLPGVIDVHSHDDAALFREDGCEPKLRQGITTTIIGNCGHGCAPTIPDGALEGYSRPVLGPFPRETWKSFEEYLDAVDRHPRTLNVAALVPHAPLRASVMGLARRAATGAEIDAMCAALAQALSAGAMGMSFGIMYAPGNSMSRAEFTELGRVVADHGGVVVAHVRNEADLILDSIDELAHVGRDTGAAVHVSHLKVTGPANVGRMPEVLARLDEHRRAGVDVTTDIYPYEAGSTTVATLFPPWTADHGNASLLETLSDERARARVVDELRRPWVDVPIENYYASLGPGRLLLAGFRLREHIAYDGKSIAEIAESRAQDPAECLVELTLAEKGDLAVILFQIDIDGMTKALQWPWTYIGSDGLPSEHGYVHPRLYGTVSRVLDGYAGAGKVLSRAEAVKRMTGAPAARFGLQDHGLVHAGKCADLLVVEPGGPFDRASFTSPRMHPDGVRAVIVNGRLAWAPDWGSSSPHGRLIRAQRVGRTL